jgi:hypothetical protein
MASRTYTNYKCWRGINTSPDSKRAARIIRLTAKSKLPTRTLKSAARGQETTYNISLLIYVLIYSRTCSPIKERGQRALDWGTLVSAMAIRCSGRDLWLQQERSGCVLYSAARRCGESAVLDENVDHVHGKTGCSLGRV